MKKDFLTITPESGGGTASVSAVADPNLLAKDIYRTLINKLGLWQRR